MKSHTFNGTKYTIWTDAKIDGFADLPKERDNMTLYVDPMIPGMGHLDTAVHEAIHACFHDATETLVGHAGRDIARFLWRLGYRRSKCVK
jgi:hypothetical protein